MLACSYFDLGHCGYFETKDLEDILTTMNLNLSRAQIKKLLTKVTSGKDQQVNYRQFTDKSEDEELVSSYFFSIIFKTIREIEFLPIMKIQFHLYVVFDFTKKNHFSLFQVCYIETDDDHLGQGFRAYLSKPKSSKSVSSSSTNSSSSEGICNYRGKSISPLYISLFHDKNI